MKSDWKACGRQAPTCGQPSDMTYKQKIPRTRRKIVSVTIITLFICHVTLPRYHITLPAADYTLLYSYVIAYSTLPWLRLAFNSPFTLHPTFSALNPGSPSHLYSMKWAPAKLNFFRKSWPPRCIYTSGMETTWYKIIVYENVEHSRKGDCT